MSRLQSVQNAAARLVAGSDLFVNENKNENENYDPFVHENEN